ncbi:MAG: aldolase/citrate lyase family protein [Anaerolineales bacterium]|nr:aldolase/citrate lyase family protein [Anaerolineales bacterium]
MKLNTMKQKLLRGETAFGYSAKLGSPVAAELLSHCGVDFVMLDGQHGSWGSDSIIQGLAAICAGPATPFVRVLSNQFHLIGQLLDAGALGLVIPMVDTVEQARAAANACRYPPVGGRSFGWGRAFAYGDDYPDWSNDQLFVTVQIESAQAVENAEAILAVPGVDGCVIGPQDLALSLGFHPREIPKRDEHARALERVVQACRNTGKIPGIDVGAPDTAAQRAALGFRCILMGSDTRFMLNSAVAGLKSVKRET